MKKIEVSIMDDFIKPLYDRKEITIAEFWTLNLLSCIRTELQKITELLEGT